MSTLHMNVHWPAIRAQMVPSNELEEIIEKTQTEKIFVAYSPKERPVALVITTIGQLLTPLFEELFVTADKLVKEKPGQAILVPLDTFRTKIDRLHGSLEKIFKDGETGIVARINIKFQECLKLLEKSKQVTLNFFNQLDEKFRIVPIEKAQREKWKQHLVSGVLNSYYEEIGARKSPNHFSYSEEDLTFFGIKPNEDIIDPKKIDCASFALLKIQEKRAKNIIFFLSNFNIGELPKHLFEWNYRVVSVPDEEDLVVYFCNGKAAHVGVFTSSGWVESKLGILNPYIHIHPIFDVPANYGKSVCFFRRSSPTLKLV